MNERLYLSAILLKICCVRKKREKSKGNDLNEILSNNLCSVGLDLMSLEVDIPWLDFKVVETFTNIMVSDDTVSEI